MLKKTMMLALAALAVLAASASAASASWTKHDKHIAANETLQLTGQAKFNSLVVGWIECQTQAKVTLFTGQTTANVEEFAIDAGSTPTKRCATGGPLTPCDVTQATSSASAATPFVAHLLPNKDTIEITTGTIQNLLEGEDATKQATHTACTVVQTIQLKPGTVHATILGQTCTVSQVSLSGQLETQTGSKVTITGTQNVGSGATYGTQCL